MNIGEKIVIARRNRGMKQSDLSRECGISMVSISHYENGRKTPSPENLVALCMALELPPQEMAQSIKEEEIRKGQDLGQKKSESFIYEYRLKADEMKKD